MKKRICFSAFFALKTEKMNGLNAEYTEYAEKGKMKPSHLTLSAYSVFFSVKVAAFCFFVS